jgi:hypothetical protein
MKVIAEHERGEHAHESVTAEEAETSKLFPQTQSTAPHVKSQVPAIASQPALSERTAWTHQTEESAVGLARINTKLTGPRRAAFIATARIIRFHVELGETRVDGFVPVTDGEIAVAAGTTNRTIQRYLKVAEDWGLIERKYDWDQETYINPETGRKEHRPVSQLLIRQKEPDFLAQVRLIATFDPGLGRNAGWGGFRGDTEADERPSRSTAHVSHVERGRSSESFTAKMQGADDKTTRLDIAPQPNASEEVPSCRTNKLSREGGDRSKGGNRQKSSAQYSL